MVPEGPAMRTTTLEPGRIGKVLAEMHRHGSIRTVHDVIVKTLNTFMVFKILRGVAVERPLPEFLECPPDCTATFLTPAAARAFARDPGNEMSESFVEEALVRGDRCFALSDGASLAAYGWYSSAPTRIDPPDLRLCFSDDYVYMYKGFTHQRYRGRRLHAIGMTMALRHFRARGYRGLVSYVESNNFSSLKSVGRMGYFQFGSVYVVKAFGRCLAFRSRGCLRFGFRVEKAGGEISGPRVRLAS
jgi:ribosomal protein S18 acetylase RimI-like enzyme